MLSDKPPIAYLDKVRTVLSQHGIKTKIIAQARSDSQYLEITNKNLQKRKVGKIRIGDHPERSRYGYRWQIRTDIQEVYPSMEKGHIQFFFPPSQIDHMAKMILKFRCSDWYD